ncbi:MAG TPA: Bax inhibitor-1/YccA family protein [Candidatus Limnocylindria bacterium]|nr:Bax inhibitor-1/YccA family protein [Candidatus Limnocylindria bacterium]
MRQIIGNRSGNPVLKESTFKGFPVAAEGEGMTIEGTVNKTYVLFLLLIVGVAGAVVAEESALYGLMLLGAIGGLVVALVTVFRKEWAPITAPVYALLEGLFVGAISLVMEAAYPGIVLPAVSLTFGTLFALLAAYRSGLIKVTDNFRLGVAAATGAIFVVYLGQFVLGLVGVQVGFLHEAIFGAGLLGIGVSVAVIIVAALNLVLDFDFIEHGAAASAPKYMEWYGAFGLLVTLIWLYIEILRLLSKLRSR